MKVTHILKQEKQQLQDKLTYIDRLLDVYGEPTNGASNVSRTDRIKNALREIAKTHEASYRIGELSDEVEAYGVETNRNLMHQALTTVREEGLMVAFRINKSNQSVYYMGRDGVGEGEYPVKERYRPEPAKFVRTFEWMD